MLIGEEWELDRNTSESHDKDFSWPGNKKKTRKVTVVASHRQLFHVELRNCGGYSLFMNMVYGANNASGRRELWSQIKQIKQTVGQVDWIIGRDFNDIWKPENRDGWGVFDRLGADEFNVAMARLT